MRKPQPHWEDVEVGTEIEGFDIEIKPRRTFLQISGSQDLVRLTALDALGCSK